MERKAHVGAAIVDGIDLIPVRDETDRVSVDVNYEPTRRPQLGKRRGADERFGGNGSHPVLLPGGTPAA
jgi:hypothetical protein